MSIVEKRILTLGFILPTPSIPVAAYVPYITTGHLVFISGQLPLENGQVKYTGRLGVDVSNASGIEAAKLCALNILAHLKNAASGDLDNVARCVKLNGFISSGPDFFEQPQIMNGASELIQTVLGEAGKHARAAIGTSNLPRNAAVEVDAIFELKL